ncbi:toll/interleukin-1 receptor domain-containing protein [Thalassospira lucentensis]|uniref:toll/interleukin-1 receptor domain-containing protein n=1 Tax=Thalassospira lucentensis TaxID=168935 RepID=UPI00399D72DE
MTKIFFSYSHADENLRDTLEKHLTALARQGLIETWHDRRITAGTELNGEISKNLDESDVILLLISPDFIASNYCFDIEMKHALSRHKAGETTVIPVILRHCDWHDMPFGKLMATPTDGKPVKAWPDLDEAFVDVIKAIKAVIKLKKLPSEIPASSQFETTPKTITPPPRSSNLRIRKSFTEADRDNFLDEGFDFLARFFQSSLDELSARNTDLDVRFKKISATMFTATIYRNGKTMARCKVALGNTFGKGITYSSNDSPEDNSCNEMMTVDNDDQNLFFKTLGMSHLRVEPKLSFEGAAEFYWSLIIRELQ